MDSDLILLNPRLPQAERERIEKQVRDHQRGDHVWVMSSGTESQRGGRIKMVALSKTALEAAARGVNQFFSISDKDIIFNTLPNFHVAGLLQSKRAKLSGAKLIQAPELTWDVHEYCQNLQSTGSTITSLVPTQIYDLVQAQKNAPTTLRCVFAGGGPLTDFLFRQALELGWPLVRTYGMTETSAMIAYKEKSSKVWRRLPHLEKWESGSDQKIKFYGPSLLTGYLLVSLMPVPMPVSTPVGGTGQWVDPKQQGWFETDDRGEIENDELLLLGRESELVKVKGESVSLLELNERWQSFCQEKQFSANSIIVCLPHERDGGEIVLVTDDCVLIEQIDDFQKKLLPFQKIQKVFAKILIPRTELGKIKTADLIHSLGSASTLLK